MDELPRQDLATYQAKLLGAAYLYESVGKDPLLAWQTVEDLADSKERLRRLRQWANAHVVIALNWPEGVKSITCQDRLDRAQKYFQRLLDEENIPGIQHWIWHPYLLRVVYWIRLPEDWRDRGFTLEELEHLRRKFEFFWQK